MKVFTYSEARQKLSKVLDIARSEDVVIKRRGGETFTLTFNKSLDSPFDVPGIKTKATTQDILDAVRESRQYKNLGSDSGVCTYQIEGDAITVEFMDGSVYRYTKESVGHQNMKKMKELATAGQGLNTFINRHIKDRFDSKLK